MNVRAERIFVDNVEFIKMTITTAITTYFAELVGLENICMYLIFLCSFFISHSF